MKKKFTYIFLIVVCLFLNTSVNAKSQQVKMGYQQFRINGGSSNVVTYYIDGENYFRIRDLAFALKGTNKKFNIGYNSVKNEVVLYRGQDYNSSGDIVVFDNDALAHDFTGVLNLDGESRLINMYNIKGYNYCKIADIAKMLDFNLKYENVSRAIVINTNEKFPLDKNRAGIFPDELN